MGPILLIGQHVVARAKLGVTMIHYIRNSPVQGGRSSAMGLHSTPII